MQMENVLNVGKACIGQIVYDCKGNKATIIDMYTLNKHKCMVKLEYDDGTQQVREKFFVSKGKFEKIGTFDIESALKTDDWKPLFGFEEFYIINKEGRVVRIKGKNKGKEKCATNHTNGYKYLTLYKDKKESAKVIFQHRCVVATFIRPLIDGDEVNHIDGDRANNKLCNLEIVNKYDNNKKFIDLQDLGLSIEHKLKIEDYCMSNNINLKEFLGYCVKELLGQH